VEKIQAMWFTFLVTFLLCTVSLSHGMIVRVDTTLTPGSNTSFHYWERVLVENGTKSDNAPFLAVDVVFELKNSNASSTGFFVIYENNRLGEPPRCCTSKDKACKPSTLQFAQRF
jgi:hypothetical protein